MTKPIIKVGNKDFWIAFFLSFPPIIRLLCPSGLEQSFFEICLLGIPFFWPNFFILLFIINAPKYKGNEKIKHLLFIQLIFVLLGVILNDYEHPIAFLLSGNFYFFSFFIGLNYSINEGQRYWVSLFFSYCLILLSLEVLLFSFGIFTSFGGNELSSGFEDYGNIIRVSTTAGAATGTACDIYLMIVLCSLTLSNKRYRLFIILLGFISLLLTVSRGGVLAVSFFLFLSFIYRLRNTRHKFKLVFLLLTLGGLFFYLGFFNPFFERLQKKNSGDDATSGRAILVEQTFSDYINNAQIKAIGLGISNVYPSTEINHAGYKPKWSGAPHNMYVLTIAEQGWIGLMLSVVIIILILFFSSYNKPAFFSLVPVFLILYNTETVVGVNSQELFIIMIILSIALDKQRYSGLKK